MKRKNKTPESDAPVAENGDAAVDEKIAKREKANMHKRRMPPILNWAE